MTRTTETVDECARRIVGEDVLVCLSSLVYELSRNCEISCALNIEDELREVSCQDDYEEPVSYWLLKQSETDLMEWLDATGAEVVEGADREQIADRLFEVLKEDDKLQDFAEEHGIEPYQIEAYEHWAVSGWLAAKLRDRGEMVTEMFNMLVWGRTTTGQMIYMDGVMQSIAEAVINY